MIVTGMLAWYDEDPAILHRAVTSLSVVADRLIAVDGRWDYYPGHPTPSPKPQYDTIRKAARNVGLDLELHLRHEAQPWAGQVAKRNHMLALAAPGSDWVLPLDADWEFQGDRDTIRQQLATTTADAMRVAFHTPPNPDAPLHDVAATNWHANLAGRTVHEPLIYRNLPGLRIERYHWCYSAIKDGHRVSLWGQQNYPQANTEDLTGLRIDHHCLHRDERTILANRIYCDQRDAYAAQHGREP